MLFKLQQKGIKILKSIGIAIVEEVEIKGKIITCKIVNTEQKFKYLIIQIYQNIYNS